MSGDDVDPLLAGLEEAVGLSFFAYFDGQQTPPKIVTVEIGPLDLPPLLNLYRVFLLSDDLGAFRNVFGRYHQACAREFHETRGLWKDYDGIMKREQAGICTRSIVPMLEGTVEQAQWACALRRAASLGVLLYRYQARHGRFPDRLEELPPELISIVPRDPYDGKPMRMKPTEEGCVIYAVGPDMNDNLGSPLDEKKESGDIVFRVGQHSMEKKSEP